MPKKVDREVERRKIVISAVKYISKNGILCFNMRDLASSCGVTKGCIQHYYSTKEALILDLIDYVEARFIDLVASDRTDSLELVHHRLSQMLPIDRERTDLWRVKLAFNILATESDHIDNSMKVWYQREINAGTRLLKNAKAKHHYPHDFKPGSSYRSLMTLVYGCALIKHLNPRFMTNSNQYSILGNAMSALIG